jgi:hypothetical protein
MPAGELNDALRNTVRMFLLFTRMLQKFRRGAFRDEALGHEIVALVSQHAHEFGGEGFIQKFQHRVAVRMVAGDNRTFFDVSPRDNTSTGAWLEKTPPVKRKSLQD